MCIAILNLNGKISKKHLSNSWENNNQGAGILWNDTETNSLNVFKTYSKKELISKYFELKKIKTTGAVVIHFRIATSGHEKFTNLHPFLVNKNLGFVHNGIISKLGNQQYSDTWEFNEMILKKIDKNFLQNDGIFALIEKSIDGSKLVFLDNFGNWKIANEQKGHWYEGNWYSNDSYLHSWDFVYFGNEKVSKGKNSVSIEKYNLEMCNDDDFMMNENELQEELMHELSFHFTNIDIKSLEKIADLYGISMYDEDFIYYLHELSHQFNTFDLLEIERKLMHEYTDDLY